MILSHGAYGRQPIAASLSHQCFSLPLPLSLKAMKNKMSLGEDNKKIMTIKEKFAPSLVLCILIIAFTFWEIIGVYCKHNLISRFYNPTLYHDYLSVLLKALTVTFTAI